VPLFPKFPLINVPGTYVAIRFEDVILALLAILTAIKVLPDLKSFLKDEIVQAFLIFFGVGLVSLLAGVFLTQTVDFKLGLFHWARRIEYSVPFFAGLTLLVKEKVYENLDFYLKILLIVVGIVFVYGFGQVYFKFPVIITQNEEYSKRDCTSLYSRHPAQLHICRTLRFVFFLCFDSSDIFISRIRPKGQAFQTLSIYRKRHGFVAFG